MDFNSNFTMTIDGEAVDSTNTIKVINPATGRMFTTAPAASAADLERAVRAAKAALPAWRALPIAERKRKLIEVANAIEANAESFMALFTREQGRPLAQAGQEILGGAYWFKATAELDLPIEVTEDSKTRRVEIHHEPLGVVCAIVPWNFPFMLAIWKIAPALLAGNTMVLKPSPYTPLCALKLGELLRGILPPGVLNVISGGDELGPLMTAHPGFAKISFTGSSATGRRVMEVASRDLKRLTLELGGNDAAIVLPDVDIEATAERLFFGAFFNTAQVCVATKRLYLHDDIYEAVRDRLHALAKKAKIGDGAEADVMFGPIQNEPQFRRVQGLLADARATGLTLLQGAEVPKQGYFIPLTLVDNPPDDSRVVVEEAFGPILPLLRFSSVDEVVARANKTDYGLAGSIWSNDIEQATAIAHRLQTGTVWINQNADASPATPIAGHKQSGIGVQNGLAGLLEFTQIKVLYVPKPAAPP